MRRHGVEIQVTLADLYSQSATLLEHLFPPDTERDPSSLPIQIGEYTNLRLLCILVLTRPQPRFRAPATCHIQGHVTALRHRKLTVVWGL